MENLDPNHIRDILALTPLQEGMLFHYLQDPQSQLYFEQLSLELSGEIDERCFVNAWNIVSETNEMLRTVFRWEKLEKPLQIILNEHPCKVIFYDFPGKDHRQKKSVVEEIKDHDRRQTFDLHQVPFRILLCKLDEKKYEMVISSHHILYDGWSNGIILKEFFKAYHELCHCGREIKLPAKPPFKDFIKWIQLQDRNKQEQFWKKYLAGIETPTELPIKRRIAEVTSLGTYSIVLEETLNGKLDIFIKNYRVTLASVFYTSWGVLLHKYCGSEDIVFGTTVSGRSADMKGIEDVVGLFINTIPLRIGTHPDEKIIDMVSRTDHILREREEFENTPLVDIQGYSTISGGGPSFDTIIVIENYPLDDRLLPEGSPLSIHSYSMVETTHYDLTVGIVPFNKIEINFNYKRDCFDKDVIENLAGHFNAIIRNIIEKPETILSQLEIISNKEKNRILYEFNNTEVEYPSNKTIHQLFVEQASRTPDRIALVGAALSFRPVPPAGLVRLSYRQLNEQSDQLAGLLIEKGILADNIVGIMMERSLEMIIGILSILKSGGAYLPIDPDYPRERIQYMLGDSNAKVLLGTDECRKKIIVNCQLLIVNCELKNTPQAPLHHSSFIIHHSNRLVYIIYTSGSTGKPKGVMIEHRSAVNLLYALQAQYPFEESSVYLLKTPYTFDVSVAELFGWYIGGGKVTALEAGSEKDPRAILESIEKSRVTHINFVPSMFNAFLEFVTEENKGRLRSLKYIFLAGEALLPAQVKKFKELNTPIALENIYGPTEGTVYSSNYPLSGWNGKGSIPIGRPLPNVKLYILDRNDHLQPVGVPGELYINGPGVSRGYLNNPELTADKFYRAYRSYTTYINYKTGDLCKWIPDGNIEYLGRLDHQVKIKGFRIEPGEIENRLLKHKKIKEAVVSAKEDTAGDKYLAVYFVSGWEIPGSELREYLAKDLPEYMIPLYFTRLEKIPLTPSGKVDRMALPEPELKAGERYAAPRDETETILLEIWSGVLGGDPLHRSQLQKTIGIDDNFFQLGGHSLKVIHMAAKIHKELNLEVSVGKIFAMPTIRSLAEYLKTLSPREDKKYTAIEATELREYYNVSSAQKRLYVLSRIETESINYNMHDVFQLEGDLDREQLEKSFKGLIARHESLRTSFHLIDDEPVQKITTTGDVEFSIEYFDLTGSAPGASTGTVNDINDRFLRPFDLSMAPLLRVGLIKIAKEKHILMAGMHHIISDGISVNIFIRDFTALYRGDNLPPLRLQYKDYSHWQNRRKKNNETRDQGEYWLREFAGDIPRIAIPYDYPRPAVQSFTGEKYQLVFGGAETGALKKRAREENVTLFMLLIAIYDVLLWRISGSEEIIVGTPVAGRRHVDLESMMGMFVNTLVLKTHINPEKEKFFRGFLEQVRQKILAAFDNQDYQFEDLVETVQPARDLGRNPLFDVLFVLQNMNTSAIEIPGLKITPFPYETHVAPFDMYMIAEERGDSLYFTTRYCTKLFKEDTIRRFMGYFTKILATVTAEAVTNLALADIEILSAGEKHQLLVEFNNTKTEYPENRTIHEWFEQQVKHTPDRIAVIGSTGSTVETLRARSLQITYRPLNEQSNRLAHLLRHKGVGRDTIVAAMTSRSIEMVVGILGILKAGGAYLPINPGHPEQRILAILEDSGGRYLLTDSQTSRRLPFTSLRGMNSRDVSPIVTGPRPQIKDFDSLPHPDRTLVDYRKYHELIGIAPAKYTINIQATRGCPYRCGYCHKIWPKTHVMRSAENIFAEIRTCYEAGVKRFVFIDDIFNLRAENSAKLFETIIKHNYKVQLFFPNGLRGDILDTDFIDLMIAAGTVDMALALETASPRLQKLINKRLNLEKFEENVHYITKKHPQVILEMELMIGFPTETEAEAMMTLELLKRFKWVHFPNLHILKIYLNTDIGKLAVANGIDKESIKRSTSLAFHELPETLPFSKRFAREYQAQFMNDYFLSKERLTHALRHQVKILTADELVQKYDSYLPADIKCFHDILACVDISEEELGPIEHLPGDGTVMAAPDFSEKIKAYYPARRSDSAANAFRVLLMDISQSFRSESSAALYDVGAEPLGLMYLATYLHEQFGLAVEVKVIKSRIDFDSYAELEPLVSRFKPHLIGLRTLSFYKEFFHRTVSVLKHWGVTAAIIAGGPYATSDYRQLLQDFYVDLVVLGEGELTAAQLVKEMMAHNNQLPPEEILNTIPGLAYIREQDKTASMTSVSAVSAVSRGEVFLLDYLSRQAAHFSADNPENINRPGDLLYMISTSGSTGVPKSVMVEHRTLVNLISYQFDRTGIDFSRVLQFAAIGFDVSLQEIFSALLGGGTLYLPDDDIRSDVPRLFDFIAGNRVNILFLPPAFLKFVFSESAFVREFPHSVQHIIAAGEQLVIDEPLRRLLKERSIYLHNHYGPSETHVVTALTIDPTGDIPQLPGIGMPVANTGIYILGKSGNIQPVGITGELYIGGIQVGRGYLNRPDLTAEKFQFNWSYRSYKTYIIYKTDDMARWLPDPAAETARGAYIIEFLGRIDSQVKIRGYRIELEEIENRLLKHPGIKEVVVLDRAEQKGDKYLCAYIVSDGENVAAKLREYLARELPEYMIPSYFVLLEKIPLTPNGKIDRRALPSPELKTSEIYTAPGNEIEKKLVNIWTDILDISDSSMGVSDNFFELGGHSLKATIMASKIHKELNVHLPLAEIFKTPTIMGLAEFIKRAEESRFFSIVRAEEKEYYALAPAQKRIYILQQLDKDGTSYNMTSLWLLEGDVNKDKLENTFGRLIQRHESLRTSFVIIGNEPVQRIHDEVEFEIEYKNLAPDEHGQTRTFLINFIRPFDLSKAPLLRVGLAKLEEEKYLLMVEMHHIISDGMSAEILVHDFAAFYPGNELPGIILQYKDYAEWRNREKQDLLEQGKYWRNEFAGEIPVLGLPTDYARPSLQSFEGSSINFELSKETTAALKALILETGATLYMILLSFYTILLAKLSGTEDIVVGAPTAGRRHADLKKIIGMFVNTLPLRNYPSGKKLFTDFVNELKEKTLQAFENQDYPYEDLVEELNVTRDASRNPLFDVMLALQNTAVEEINIPGLKLSPYPYENRTAKFDLTLSGVESDGKLFFTLEYCTKLFREETINRIIVYFKNIVNSVIDNKDRRISDIEIITAEERARILFDFNDTEAEYPTDKTIHGLFEKQVEKAPDFIAVLFYSLQITYRKLSEQSDRLAGLLVEKGVLADNIVGIMAERSVEMIVGILGILKSGAGYLPIDLEYPQERIEYMLKDSAVKILLGTEECRKKIIVNCQLLIVNCERTAPPRGLHHSSFILHHSNHLAYIIYTSGTTGRPKGAMIEHRNVARLLFNEKFQFDFNNRDTWTMFHSYCFDFSVWEMYGALLYGGKLVIIDKITARDTGSYLKILKEEGVTVLNQTPQAFYNLAKLELSSPGSQLSARYVIFGGEALTPSRLKDWKSKYPVTKLINMYGITETTVHVTFKEIGDIEIDSTANNIGKPIPTLSVYIVDKNLELLPIGIPGEMIVGGKGVGRGYLNQPELTAKRFYRSYRSYKTYIFYKTGDLARWLPDGNIEYLGRIDHQVKIRGYRIELGEIENRLLKHEKIKEAVILANEDMDGDKYLAAYFVSDIELSGSVLIEYLLKNLPGYMIPSYFVQLEKIPLTANGKVDRRALPKPGLKVSERYTAPKNEIEKKLAEIWSEVLSRDRLHMSQLQVSVGIDDDFFQLGGHSLKATILAAKIHKAFQVNVSLAEIFKTPTIRELSNYIKSAVKGRYVSLDSAEKKEYYAVSSAQKRLYILYRMDQQGVGYNIPSFFILEGEVDKDKLEHTFRSLIRRHESLRTSFHMIKDEPVQRIQDEVEFEIEWAPDIRNFIRPFNLTKAPLLRVGLVKEKEGSHILMVDMHHIISDGASMNIVVKDFMALYQGEDLPELQLQYKDFSEWRNREYLGESIRRQKDFWLKEFAGEIPVLELPVDYTRPPVQDFEGSGIYFEIDIEATGALKKLTLEMGVTVYMVLLAIYTVFLAKISNQEDIVVGSPIAGRRHADLEKIIGMFVNTLALRNYPAGEKTFAGFLWEVKEKALGAFENQDYQFEDLVEWAATNRDTSRNPIFDVMFVFRDQDMGMTGIEIPGLVLKPYEYENKTAKFDLNLSGMEKDRKLTFVLEYSTKLFKAETARNFSGYFKNILNAVIENPAARIAAVEIMSKQEKERILEIANGAPEPVDSNETVHGMFEKIAIGNEDKTALVFRDGRMTYGELNKRANRLARLLWVKGVGKDSIIGLRVERSFELVVGMLGIMKAGGAYLPIDPKLPQERIEYMLKDSDARLLVTASDKEGEKVLPEEISPSPKSSSYLLSFSSLTYVIYTSGSTGRPKGVMLEHTNLVNLIRFHHRYTGIDCSKVLQFTTVSFDVSFQEIFSTLSSGGELYLIDEQTRDNIVVLLEFIRKNKIKTLFLPMSFLRLIFDGEYTNEFPPSVGHIITAGEQAVVNNRLRNCLKENNIYFHNHYGPSETHVITTYTMNPRKDIPEFPSIGKPVMNTGIYIMDKEEHLLPVGMAGELYAGGLQVGRGYLNNPELTAERFYRSNRSYKTYIFYKTGDLARFLPNGNIEFLGRIDQQVKIRGIRVEPGEIERQLEKIEIIKDAVVVVKQDKSGEKYLCAYIVLSTDAAWNDSELRNILSVHLPDYMIPTYFIQMDKIPLTPSGKIDRKALPEPGLKIAESYIAPRNVLEKKLAALWAEVLSRDASPASQLPTSIGITDNFFQLGGHSLKAVILISKIHKELNIKVPLAEIFKTPSIMGLAEFIKRTGESGFFSLARAEKKEYYALASAQKRIYILQQMDKDGTTYNIPSLWLLEGVLNRDKLNNAIDRLIQRHESLRTSFLLIGEEPVQRIHDEAEFEIEYKDLATDEHGQTRTFLINFIRPFDLSRAPLLRAGLVKLAEDRHIFLVDMHHIISDGMSTQVLAQDFSALYAGAELPGIMFQYKDYAEWQNRERVSKKALEQGEYWKKEFEGEIPVLDLPTDYARPAAQAFEGSSINFELSSEISGALKALALEAGATLYIVLLALYTTLLAKLCGQEDIVIGSPVAGRRHADLEKIIGMFVNTLALRNYPTGEKTFNGYLHEVKEKTLSAFENQDHPYEDLVDQVVMNRDVSRNPLFDVMFVLQNTGSQKLEIPGLKLVPYDYDIKTTKVDLGLTAVEAEEKLLLTFRYSTKLFKHKTIERLIGYFKNVITHIISKPIVKISEVEIIPEETRKAILNDFNENLNEVFELKPIQTILPDIFEKYRKNTAIDYGATCLTYAELEHRALCISQWLADRNIPVGSFIGIYSEDRINIVSSIIGILRRACIFVPMDTDLPGKRVESMMRLTNMRAIITDTVHETVLKGIEEKDFNTAHIFTLNDSFDISRDLDGNKNDDIKYDSEDKIYVYFTSGSTGIPNAIVGKNKSLVQFLKWEIETFAVNETYRISQLTAVGFDAFLRDVFVPLFAGGAVCIPGNKEILMDGDTLIDWLDRNRIDLVHCVPSLFRMILSGKLTPELFPRLKNVLLSGEPINPKELQGWYQVFGERIQLVNYYGPTETTMIKTFHHITMGDIEACRIPAGRPIRGTRIIILDKYMKICDRGIMGEIHIRTAYGTHGYLDNPGLNARRFIKNPFGADAGDLVYKTGDLGKILENGEIVVFVRIDRQVKIRGARIELENIENCLLQHDRIERAIVICRKDRAGENYLCAYIVFKKQETTGDMGDARRDNAGDNPSTQELREYLTGEFPGYMIPSYFIPIHTVPLTSTGKIDWLALPGPDLKIGDNYNAPRNETEKKMVRLWVEILAKDHLQATQLQTTIGIDDNFFELGGHSLKATILAAKIHKEFDVKVPLVEIFKTPRIKELVKYITGKSKEFYISMEPSEEKEYYELTPAQKRLYILWQLNPGSTAYNMPLTIVLEGKIGTGKLQEVFAKLIARHESFRTSFRIITEEPVQVIHEVVDFQIEYYELKRREQESGVIKKFIRPFDLSQAPLVRVSLIKSGEEKYILRTDMHHIISDAISHRLLIMDFLSLYRGDVLEPLKLQYKDYAEWQNRQIERDMITPRESYWLTQFSGPLPLLDLPTDYPRPVNRNFEGSMFGFQIGKDRIRKLNRRALAKGATLQMVMLAILNILLAKLTHQEDIIICMPAAGRRHADLEKIIGIFVNTLALRSFPTGNKTFSEFLTEVRENSLKAYDNQDYPFDLLVKKVIEGRDTDRNPLFEVMLEIQENPAGADNAGLEIPDLKALPYEMEPRAAKLDLDWIGIKNDHGLFFELHYSTELFKEESIKKLSERYLEIIDQVLENEDMRLEDIKISHRFRKAQAVAARESGENFTFEF